MEFFRYFVWILFLFLGYFGGYFGRIFFVIFETFLYVNHTFFVLEATKGP